MNHCRDLREYIDRLKTAGEVQEIASEVDWHLEIGAVMRRANDLMAPAPWFRNIKGYPGFSLLGSPVSGSRNSNAFYSRIAISLGLPPDSGATAIIETLASLFRIRTIPPRIVKDAPCKRHKMLGKDVDLFKLPVPYLHDGDGARYIGTWHTIITRAPDAKWTNWGMYRVAAHDRTTMGGPMVPAQHIGMHLLEWKKIGKPMPFAMVIGSDPLTPLVASMGIPVHVNEADVIGGYLGAPIDLVNGETVDLQVPASAEIVIEGVIPLDETRPEGPFGEYTGFMSAGGSAKPVYKVTAITHRDQPIFTAVCPGVPVEDHLSMSLSIAAEALTALREHDIPVKMACMPPCSAMHFLAVSVDKSKYRNGNIARRIGEIVWSIKAGVFIPKILVLDHDADVTNLQEVVWHFGTKCHPGSGSIVFPDTRIFPLFPFLTPEEKKSHRCPTVVYDCTWPSDWPREYVPRKASFDTLWPKDVQERVLRNWKTFGYADPS
jgi:4-hydroxy-3-polyprenylbenzoate decarboxylase